MNDLASRLLAIKDQIASLTHHAGRAPDDVQLLAVSKTKPIEAIYAAYHAGQRQFGVS